MDSTVMNRPEEVRIHGLAVRAAPDAIKDLNEHLAKPQNVVVAIERHNSDWRDGRKQDREHFLWVKAKNVSQGSHRLTTSLKLLAAPLPSPLCMTTCSLPLTFILETHRRRHQGKLLRPLQVLSRTTYTECQRADPGKFYNTGRHQLPRRRVRGLHYTKTCRSNSGFHLLAAFWT